MNNNLVGFLKQIYKHSIGFLSGSLASVLLGAYQQYTGKNINNFLYTAFLLLGLFYSCYLAWKDKADELDSFRLAHTHKQLTPFELREKTWEYIEAIDNLISLWALDKTATPRTESKALLTEVMQFVSKQYPLSEYQRLENFEATPATIFNSMIIAKSNQQEDTYLLQELMKISGGLELLRNRIVDNHS